MLRGLCAAAVFASLVMTGCKSDMEQYAEDVCACSDKKCLDEVVAKWKDKIPKGEQGEAKKMEDLPEKDKEAMGKALACSLKASGLGEEK